MEVMEFMIVTKTRDEIMATVLRSADSSAVLGRAFIVIIGAVSYTHLTLPTKLEV